MSGDRPPVALSTVDDERIAALVARHPVDRPDDLADDLRALLGYAWLHAAAAATLLAWSDAQTDDGVDRLANRYRAACKRLGDDAPHLGSSPPLITPTPADVARTADRRRTHS